jgi:hypothetical protein
MDVRRLAGAYTRTETWSELNQSVQTDGAASRPAAGEAVSQRPLPQHVRPLKPPAAHPRLEVAARLASQTADLLSTVRKGLATNASRYDLQADARLLDSAEATLRDLLENSRAEGQPIVAPEAGPRATYQSAENFGPILRRLSETMLGPGGVVNTMQALRSPDEAERASGLEQVARLEARLHALADPLRRASASGDAALDLTA